MTQLKRFSSFATQHLLLASFVGCVATPHQESIGEYIDGSILTTKIKTEIFHEDSLKSSEINIETFKGVVQMSGFVSSRADINKAVEVAHSIKGVKLLKNDMQVK